MKMAIMAAWGIFLVAAVSVGAVAQDARKTQPAEFMIFFDWGKPAISRDGLAVIDESAAAWRSRPGEPMTIEGHSDRSGSAGANFRSARLRAAAVRDELVLRGVPAALISVRSLGEERPLIATEDGVREAQNRRVDISIGVR